MLQKLHNQISNVWKMFRDILVVFIVVLTSALLLWKCYVGAVVFRIQNVLDRLPCFDRLPGKRLHRQVLEITSKDLSLHVGTFAFIIA